MICLKLQQFVRFSSKKSAFKKLHDDNRIFTNIYGRHDWRLKGALQRGDWHKTDKILNNGSEWIINQIGKSGLRGRSGDGFPLAHKLKFMLQPNLPRPSYIVVNGAEGEPGTCKDREILRHEPHKVIEGALILGRAVGAKAAVVYMRGEFYNEACNLQTAVAEAYKCGLIGANACGCKFDFDIFIQRGAGRYICGEETALLNCLKGSEGRPSKKPPFPTEIGIYDKSTMVLNTETLAVTSTICRRGPKWFADLGCPPHSTGTKLFNISGHVINPCTVEESLGVPLRQLIDCYSGGVRGGWNNLLAIIPGGASTSLLSAKQCNDLKLDFNAIKSTGSDLGTGGIMVLDKSTDIMKVMLRTLRFFKHASCHQCAKCREASEWYHYYAKRFSKGNAQMDDIAWVWEIAKWASNGTICSFAIGNADCVVGFLRNFRNEFENRIQKFNKS